MGLEGEVEATCRDTEVEVPDGGILVANGWIEAANGRIEVEGGGVVGVDFGGGGYGNVVCSAVRGDNGRSCSLEVKRAKGWFER